MPKNKWTTVSKKTSNLLPSDKYPPDLIMQLLFRTQKLGESPQQAMKSALVQMTAVLAANGLTYKDYETPGQSISGPRYQYDIMIETDSYWWNIATKNGMPTHCLCPPSGTENGGYNLAGITLQEMMSPSPALPPEVVTWYLQNEKSSKATGSKTKRPSMPATPPNVRKPTDMPLSAPGLVVPNHNPDHSTGEIYPPYETQHRREVIRQLGFMKDAGITRFNLVGLVRECLKTKMLRPDPNTNDNNHKVQGYLDEMGIVEPNIPDEFPVLSRLGVEKKAVYLPPEEPQIDSTDMTDEDAASLNEFLGRLNESEGEPTELEPIDPPMSEML